MPPLRLNPSKSLQGIVLANVSIKQHSFANMN